MSAAGSVVSRWFGPHFSGLHPQLQALHLHGGRLSGLVVIETGAGIAGWIGRRIARSMGIPSDQKLRGYQVEISHSPDALYWRRRFDNGVQMDSRFSAVGALPDGYWIESTGALELKLTVDVVNGGWVWRTLGVRLHGIALPLLLLPRTSAGKHIEDGKYRFFVKLSLPVLGKLLSYGGVLELETAA